RPRGCTASRAGVLRCARAGHDVRPQGSDPHAPRGRRCGPQARVLNVSRGGRYAETTVEHSPERELKLVATPDFRMPSVYGLVGPTVRQGPVERNETTYYDTDDLRLPRWGASLRHRPGEGWTVKLPAERDAPYLVRPEIVFEGNGGVPAAAGV